MSTYIVMERAARMPQKCWTGTGRYRRIAVVEIDPAKLPEGCAEPRMISARSRGVVRVVRTWERVYEGSTDRCAAVRALEAARERAANLNAGA